MHFDWRVVEEFLRLAQLVDLLFHLLTHLLGMRILQLFKFFEVFLEVVVILLDGAHEAVNEVEVLTDGATGEEIRPELREAQLHEELLDLGEVGLELVGRA